MFIEFDRIEFRNFKAIKEGVLFLKDREVVLIQGVNNDKSGSNGAGKSTIANGLLWCLYNRTLVGKETEKEIIPKTEFTKSKDFQVAGGCCVAVYFTRDGVKYKIERYRKNPIHKNAVVIYKFDENNNSMDISKCTDKDTNLLIEEIVGADYYSFVHSNIFSFSNITPFLERGDGEKKELILPKYFIDMFRSAYKKCSCELNEVDSKLKDIGVDILSHTVKLSEKYNVKEDVLKDIEKRDKDLAVVKEELFTERENKEVILKSIDKLLACLIWYDSMVDRIKLEKDEHQFTLDHWLNECTLLITLMTNVATLERDSNKKKLEFEKYKHSDETINIKKFTELSETIKDKDKLYTELVIKIETLQKELETRQKVLKDIVVAKNVLQKAYSSQVVLFDELTKESTSLELKKSTLLTQKIRIENEYYSEQCKTCPASKMQGFFNETDTKVEAINKELQRKQQSIFKFQKSLDELNKDLQEVIVLEKECNEFIRVLETGEFSRLKGEFLVVKGALQDLQKTLIDVKAEIYDAEDVTQTLSTLKSDIIGLEDDLGKINSEMYYCNEQQPEKNRKYYEGLCQECVSKLGQIEQERFVAQTKLTSEQTDLKVKEERLKGLEEVLEVDTGLEEKLAVVTQYIIVLQETKVASLIEQEELNKRLKILEFWKKGFGPTGIEGFMLDSLINALNSLIAKYLGYLTNNTISLTLIPDSTLKTGDTRNKIADKVENDFGGETYRTNSEGEKRVMDIAVSFALKYIYEQITGTTYNILFIDEAFDNLDASTCGLVISLINTLDNIASIFVISHNDSIALEFDSFVEMIKTKGITEIIDGNN